MATTQGIGHRVDSGQGLQVGRRARIWCAGGAIGGWQGPTTEEFDLDDAQSVEPEYGLDLTEVEPGRDRSGQIVGVQADSGETGRRGRLAPFGEPVARRSPNPAPDRVKKLATSSGDSWSATVGRGLDHHLGILALAAELLGLNRGSSGPVVAKTIGPDLVESGPVPLQVTHYDADPDHVVQAAPAAARMATRLSKIC